MDARYLESGEVLLERDSIAPLNIVRKVDERVVVFPSTSPNELRMKVYDSLRGVHDGIRLRVRISYATGKHLTEQ